MQVPPAVRFAKQIVLEERNQQLGQESSPVLLQIIPRLRHQLRDDFFK